VAEGTRLLSE